MTAPQTWLAIEIGCAACQQTSRVIGVFLDVDEAIEAADRAYDEHDSPCTQYNTEVHRLPAPV